MADVDYLYETPETGELHIGPDGRATRVQTGAKQQSVPDASFTGASRPTIGMGGSATPLVQDRVARQAATPSGHRAPKERAPTRVSFDTKLSPEEMSKFQNWKALYAPSDSGEDYDYAGAFKAGERPGENGHWTDRFKKPNHPTFSTESQYSKYGKPGRWAGDTFVPNAEGRALTPEEMLALADAMQQDIQSQMAQPYEPAVHPDMNVPYWLQQYAKTEGLK